MPPKYKPGGKRFQPRTTSNSLPKQVVSDHNSVSSELSAPSGLDQEAENQFELELCWCVQQLQISLDGGKLSEKQTLEAIKTLNLLKSGSIALIRKRQAMRNTFGDYRAKMILEEKKHGRYVSNFKFSLAKADANKSVFLKKVSNDSVAKSIVDEESSNGKAIDCKKTFVMNKEPSDVPFRFNFCVTESK